MTGGYTRFQDWPLRLEQFFREAEAKRFVRGEWDCALFACAAFHAMTGVDFGTDFREQYTTREEADALLLDGGFESLEAIANATLGVPLPTVLKAQRGDIVLFETPEGQALGVVDLTGQYFCGVSQNDGLVRQKLNIAILAWRV